VLVGAGHAHLHTIRQAAEFVREGFELVLVAPDAFWYSGLATGMLGGQYPPELDHVNVGALIERGGGRFVQDHVTAIDVARQRILLAQGEPLDFDVISLNLGSGVPADAISGLAQHATLVKPIRNLWNLRRTLEEQFASSDGKHSLRVVIVGGGPTGCELAANVRQLADDRRGAVDVTVLAEAERLLESIPRRAAERVVRVLERRGVKIQTHSAVERIESGEAILSDGRRVPFDLLVGAIGLRPSPLVRATGLPCDVEGALIVDEHLRSVASPLVLGGGDCVALRGRRLAKVGVYAVRQAPILCHNLLATLAGRPLARFRPQRRFLLILNLGDGRGLAIWGPFWWLGRTAFWLKDRIDRRFLASYQDGLPPPPG
jgi:NADH dehydrogenase FAD-containing subunit